MKALLVRFLKDTSGNGVVSQAVLVTGSSLVIIPTVDSVAAKLVAIFTKLTKALH
jgi:Flp pilus assembly pilin Flp